ncbi:MULTISPECIES: winged helix-turn-helix transcriptional regulator [Mycobacteriaceae]|nr:response regulator transcription factor [Mycobacteroides abscessus]NOR01566.1 response regulator transcription factor [Mycolicibacterium fortuitum]EIC71237.1 putative response regulator [Mycobacteroides abscessus M94]MDB2195065.1 response regulator transcription factor [Mycobacteroides abscessus subsp. abscessus]MDB2198760.1 response regulator transcription factor [Mycobacteroides abscessus subsp. abscessus]MDM2080713.1 response regulator transcription factor [Mycobacteroides abscessus]
MTIEVRRADEFTRPAFRAAVGPARGSLLLVDTDAVIAEQLMEDAARIGIDTVWCSDGAEALLTVGAEPPNTLVLQARTDIVDAATIAAAVRGRWSLPILVGSAPEDDDVARRVLEAGASAVIARPYDITAISPFALSGDKRPDEPATFFAGPIHVDPDGYETRVRGREVQLTQRELELLIFLIKQRGRVVSSEDISDAVWGRVSDTNTVAVHVKRLRDKLGVDAEHGEFIRTIRGAGYRLAPSIYT